MKNTSRKSKKTTTNKDSALETAEQENDLLIWPFNFSGGGKSNLRNKIINLVNSVFFFHFRFVLIFRDFLYRKSVKVVRSETGLKGR